MIFGLFNKDSRVLSVFFIHFFVLLVYVIVYCYTLNISVLSHLMHLTVDVTSVFFAALASVISTSNFCCTRKSFGYFRYPVIAALFNGILVVIMVVEFFVHSVLGFLSNDIMLFTAKSITFGVSFLLVFRILSVLFSTFILRYKNDMCHNVNERAVYLHLLADLYLSVNLFLGNVAIWGLGALGFATNNSVIFFSNIFNFFCVFILLFFVLIRTLKLIVHVINLLAEGVPPGIDISSLRSSLLQKFPFLNDVRHIHVWALDELIFLASLHLVLARTTSTPQRFTKQISDFLRNKWNISHTTVQIDYLDMQ